MSNLDKLFDDMEGTTWNHGGDREAANVGYVVTTEKTYQSAKAELAKLREENATMRDQWHEEHEEMADYIAKLREENEVAMPLLKLAADMLREIHIEEHRDGCGGTRACPTWLLSQSIYEALSPPSEA